MFSLTDKDLNKVLSSFSSSMILDIIREAPVFLSGGYIRDVLCGVEPNDIDLFLFDILDRRYTIDLIGNKLKSIYLKKLETRHTVNAINFTIKDEYAPKEFKYIQLITCNAGSPIRVMETFDFSICKASIWYDSKKGFLSVIGGNFYEDIKERRLRVEYFDLPGLLERTIKFVNRGYRIYAEDLTSIIEVATRKILVDIDNDGLLNLPNKEELKALIFSKFFSTKSVDKYGR
jgi:hypothetical protein